MVVAYDSQAGGLSGSAVSVFPAFPPAWAVHWTVTQDDNVSAEIERLLAAPTISSAFIHFPATGPQAHPILPIR
jgi:hypothetical protein